MSGTRYPLIIQTHGYNKNRFWADGPFTTAAAAQPLANRGFLVLQVPTVNPYTDISVIDKAAKLFDTEAEGPYATSVFEAAVDELDRAGLVNPARVGLTGFSRTVYHVAIRPHAFRPSLCGSGCGRWGEFRVCGLYLLHGQVRKLAV